MPLDKRNTAALPLDHAGHFDTSETTQIDSLVHAYYADVLRLCRSILQEPADAEDAAQETFIAAASSLQQFRGEAKVKTWLFGIAINICRTLLRKRRRWLSLKQALLSFRRPQTTTRSPEELAVRSEMNRELFKAVDSLPEKHRIAVILYYIHDLSVPEISQLLDTNPGTIHSRLHHARKQLHHLVRLG